MRQNILRWFEGDEEQEGISLGPVVKNRKTYLVVSTTKGTIVEVPIDVFGTEQRRADAQHHTD